MKIPIADWLSYPPPLYIYIGFGLSSFFTSDKPVHGETPGYDFFQVTVTQQTRLDFMISFINEYILDTFLRFSFIKELASLIRESLTPQ